MAVGKGGAEGGDKAGERGRGARAEEGGIDRGEERGRERRGEEKKTGEGKI